MKSILIAASIVGIAGAAVILYLQRRNSVSYSAGKVVDAASNAYKGLNDGIDRIDRPAHHAMG